MMFFIIRDCGHADVHLLATVFLTWHIFHQSFYFSTTQSKSTALSLSALKL